MGKSSQGLRPIGGCLGSEGPPLQEDESTGTQSGVSAAWALRSWTSSVDGFT